MYRSNEGYFGITVTPNPADGQPIAVLTKYNANGTLNQDWNSAAYDAQIVSAITTAIPKVLPKLDDALGILKNGLTDASVLPAPYNNATVMNMFINPLITGITSVQFSLNLTLSEGVLNAAIGLNQFVTFEGKNDNDYYSATTDMAFNKTVYGLAVDNILGGSSTLATFSQDIPADIAAKLLALGSELGAYTNTTGYDTGHGVLDKVSYDGNSSAEVLFTLTVADLEKFSQLAHRYQNGGFEEGFTYTAYFGSGDISTAPEPATMLILGLGIAGLGLARRRMVK